MAKKNQNNATSRENISKKTSARNEPSNGKESKRKAGKISLHGFSEKELVDILKKMIRSRTIDDKAMRLLKQGKTFFHIAAAGHEAVQIAIGMQMDSQKDWFFPYYRDHADGFTEGLVLPILQRSWNCVDGRSDNRRSFPRYIC